MTNNLKAERTLTAEELQAIIDGCEGVTPGPWKFCDGYTDNGGYWDGIEAPSRYVLGESGVASDEDLGHMARLDPETVKAMASMALQSLSTQQPMGEPVAWMHPTAGWARTKYHSVLIHCQKDGPGPVPLYASPQPEAIITDEMVERGSEGLRKMYHGDEDEPFHLMAKAVLTAALIPTHNPLQEEG